MRQDCKMKILAEIAQKNRNPSVRLNQLYNKYWTDILLEFQLYQMDKSNPTDTLDNRSGFQLLDNSSRTQDDKEDIHQVIQQKGWMSRQDIKYNWWCLGIENPLDNFHKTQTRFGCYNNQQDKIHMLHFVHLVDDPQYMAHKIMILQALQYFWYMVDKYGSQIQELQFLLDKGDILPFGNVLKRMVGKDHLCHSH
eukprot:CAMPEP_0201479444 /NCGR_PEP_ID=MMETSP0151_2-20130828/4146_1 /ASSEMBLY_ACC=CAM_ASM_000257 /TAXON_ID=200890 /ORGANISM="Paramoeba atlantica, Strain 621/1 / CCAP 1560/9" /LENGTH=194 /DNA_ID=CAMNT_0047860941 /DNA_START=177 /DNA_END=761 /DNA_ORIENTATION=+